MKNKSACTCTHTVSAAFYSSTHCLERGVAPLLLSVTSQLLSDRVCKQIYACMYYWWYYSECALYVTHIYSTCTSTWCCECPEWSLFDTCKCTCTCKAKEQCSQMHLLVQGCLLHMWETSTPIQHIILKTNLYCPHWQYLMLWSTAVNSDEHDAPISTHININT